MAIHTGYLWPRYQAITKKSALDQVVMKLSEVEYQLKADGYTLEASPGLGFMPIEAMLGRPGWL